MVSTVSSSMVSQRTTHQSNILIDHCRVGTANSLLGGRRGACLAHGTDLGREYQPCVRRYPQHQHWSIQGLALRRWATTDTHGAIYLAANRDLRRRNHASQGQQRLCTPFDAILALGMRTKERRRLENTQPAPSCTHTTAYLATGRRQRYIATPTPTARQILETSPSSHHRH